MIPPPAAPPRPSALPVDELVIVQPALPASLRPMRRSLTRWLAAAAWPEPAAADIELAVNEALANVIDHAYLDGDPGPIHLHAWITTPTTNPAAIAAPAAAAEPPETTTARPTAPSPTASILAAPILAAPLTAAPGFPVIPALAALVSHPIAPTAAAAGLPAPRVATIAVSDRGRWTPERRRVDPAGHRGYGLTVMTGLMTAVHLQRSAGGTTVVLVSQPAPA